MLPGLEMMACPEMAVSMDVMQHVINVESSRNPYAIGVVGGALVRQPKALDEALATVRMLECLEKAGKASSWFGTGGNEAGE